MLDTAEVSCPYCGERQEVVADCSAGDRDYVEDCQVCCRPIMFGLRVDADGELGALEAHREDD